MLACFRTHKSLRSLCIYWGCYVLAHDECDSSRAGPRFKQQCHDSPKCHWFQRQLQPSTIDQKPREGASKAHGHSKDMDKNIPNHTRGFQCWAPWCFRESFSLFQCRTNESPACPSLYIYINMLSPATRIYLLLVLTVRCHFLFLWFLWFLRFLWFLWFLWFPAISVISVSFVISVIVVISVIRVISVISVIFVISVISVISVIYVMCAISIISMNSLISVISEIYLFLGGPI